MPMGEYIGYHLHFRKSPLADAENAMRTMLSLVLLPGRETVVISSPTIRELSEGAKSGSIMKKVRDIAKNRTLRFPRLDILLP
jgi:hypothetical protein